MSAHIRSASSVPESAAAMVLASPPMSAAPSPLSPHPPRHIRFPTSSNNHNNMSALSGMMMSNINLNNVNMMTNMNMNMGPSHEPPPSLPGTPLGNPLMMSMPNPLPASLRDPLIATPSVGLASWTPPSPAPRRFAPSKRATLLQPAVL
jgi:hypothetical protein